MAGRSQRFIDEGFTLPKYMLYVGNKTLFNISVSSFSLYFKTCKFLFIARNLFDTEYFLQKEIELLGIIDYQIIILDNPTKGQAETVYIGLKKAGINAEEQLTIFNIDTFRFGFEFPSSLNEWDGFIEVFSGSGNNWSYAKTENKSSTKVVETAEKKPISNYCSTGLYYFKSVKIFYNSFLLDKNSTPIEKKTEIYIAPLYNFLIKKGLNIHINLIDKLSVKFCGIPEEYYTYLNNNNISFSK